LDVRLTSIIERGVPEEGALLPILLEVQTAFGCPSAGAESAIASALNHYRAEACQARGIEALVPAAEEVAGTRSEPIRDSSTSAANIPMQSPNYVQRLIWPRHILRHSSSKCAWAQVLMDL
jgi:hypothetical protein